MDTKNTELICNGMLNKSLNYSDINESGFHC